jgi:peroxiredoxin
MNARTKMMSVLGLSLAVLGAAAWAGDDKGKEAKGAKVGEAAPAFTLKDTKGQTHNLSDFAGKIVVIEWFNNDCPYCVGVYEKGVVKKTLDQLKEIDAGIVYLAINSTANKPMEDVVLGSDEFLAKNNINIPMLMDYDGKTGHAYGAKTTPHMFVIDDKGVLRYQGAFTDDSSAKKADATNYVITAVQQIKAGETVSPDYVKSWGCSVKYAKSNKDNKSQGKGGEKSGG